MTVTLSSDHAFYAFDATVPAALMVPQGIEFVLETMDCFGNQVTDAAGLESLDWEHINPATGPVYIEGVEPGDLVRVRITSLRVGERGTLCALPGEGAMRSLITVPETTFVANTGDSVVLQTGQGEVILEAKPMLGVIGLAPAPGTTVPNGTPGEHGGNMDCKLIGEGTTVYFRAAVPGGLFGAGDAHSLMGDGEVLVCGAESAAVASFIAEVVDAPALPTPFFETDEVYSVIVAASTTDEAYARASELFLGFLKDIVGLSVNDAARLMTLAGDLKFCQVVDPQLTVRFEFPKSVLRQLGFAGIAA